VKALAAGNWHRAWRYGFVDCAFGLSAMFYFSDHTAEAPEWYRSWRENYQNYSWSELLVPILFLATSLGYLHI